MSNCPDENSRRHFIHVIENAILPNSQFPDRLSVLPGRDQPNQNLPVAALPRRFLSSLYFNAIQDRDVKV